MLGGRLPIPSRLGRAATATPQSPSWASLGRTRSDPPIALHVRAGGWVRSPLKGDPMEWVVAFYAAIVGTAALALEARRWREEQPRIKLSCFCDKILVPLSAGETLETTPRYIFLDIENRGLYPVRIRGVYIHRYPTWFHAWRRKASESAFLLRQNPLPNGRASGVPLERLEPGCDTQGIWLQDGPLLSFARTGEGHIEVSTTGRTKPWVAKMPVPRETPEPGA